MKNSKKKFPDNVRKKALLWSDRHCCLCGKQCGLDIELHHIEASLEPPQLNEIDNAIPVCYDCHSKLEYSLLNSPRGSKYSPQEIKDRRDQIYEEKTRHLVPILTYGPTDGMQFPKVQFYISNHDGSLNAQALCKVEIYINNKLFGTPTRHYSGEHTWVCNPGLASVGWFDLSDPQKLVKKSNYRGILPDKAKDKDLRLRVHLTIIDTFERKHERIPVEWYFSWGKNKWEFDP
jgi:hypothetical protein